MSLSSSQRAQAHLSGLSTDVAQKYQFVLPDVENMPIRSRLSNGDGLLTVSDTAYWVYVGQASRDLRATQIYFWVSVAGVGTKVQELAIAHSSAAPNRAAQSVTVDAVASTTGDYVGGTGAFTNTTAFSYTIPAGTQIWLGCRFALTTVPTQPTLAGLVADLGRGAVLSTASAGVLAAGSSYTGALISQSTTLTTVMGPDLSLVVV